ncbi:MAG: DUF4405 domain-containing protein, partial [Oscillospiraceae bacterium]|nr:DUF4405 domain-containing protein [Oscillospiraceae bacterium]
MEKKTKKLAVCRIVLDIVMLVLAASMFSHRAISQMYHEVGGLVLIALFLVHCIINHKMIKGLFAKREVTSARINFLRILNIANAVTWLAVLVTSVLVSREVFPFGMRGWQRWHKFASAVAILTTGVHFGMHWTALRVKFNKANAAVKVIVIVLLAALLSYGGHGLYGSNYLSWFSAPFSAHQMRGGRRIGERGEWRRGGENVPWNGEEADREIAAPVNESDNNAEQQTENAPIEGKTEAAPWDEENGENSEDGEGRRGRRGRGERRQDEDRRGRRNRGEGEDNENRWREGRRERGERENGENFRGEGRGRRGENRGRSRSGSGRLPDTLATGC